jgi:hypothetical protein
MNDLKITVEDPDKVPAGGRAEAKRQQVRAGVEAVKARIERNAAAEPGPTKETAPPPRESVDSVELALPDGRTILFGPPPGISLNLRIPELLGEEMTRVNALVLRVLLSVRAINGSPPPQIFNKVDMHKVAHVLGDDAIDALAIALDLYWPPVTVKDLRVVKKNLR